MMLRSFEIFRISFKEEDGKIVKKFDGIIQPKDYDDIELGLAFVISYMLEEKKLPMIKSSEQCNNDNLFTIIFKKDAMNHYHVETLAAMVEPSTLENILLGLMSMQVKIHLERMTKNEIKLLLEQDDSIGTVNYTKDDDLV